MILPIINIKDVEMYNLTMTNAKSRKQKLSKNKRRSDYLKTNVTDACNLQWDLVLIRKENNLKSLKPA